MLPGKQKRYGLALTYLGQARQINQGQVENMRRVDLEVYGLPVDTLVVASNSSRLILNFPLDIREISEATVWDMVELGPFRTTTSRGGPVRVRNSIGSSVFLRDIDELKNQWPTRDDAASSGKEISAHYVFEDGRFSSRL